MRVDLYKKLRSGVGPRVCVLADGQVSALNLESLLTDFLTAAGIQLKVVVASRGERIDPIKFNIELCNSADILIISPTAFSDHKEEIMIDLGRCCHLVIESADKTLNHHETAVERFLSTWRKERELVSPEVPDQLIVVAQEWNDRLEMFHKSLVKQKLEPWMIFASLSEAAVFTGMRFCPSYQETMDCRLDHLRQIILTDDQQKKVVCCSENTIRRVSERLEQFDILVVDRNSISGNGPLALEMSEELQEWEESPDKILVMSDQLLNSLIHVPDLPVSLVHFGLDCSKKLFEMRFKFLKSQLNAQTVGNVHILVGPEDEKAFGTLQSLLTRSNTKRIPSTLTPRTAQDICPTLVGGSICQSLTCRYRHTLDAEADQVQGGLSEEEVRFRVMKVLSPVTFLVRLKQLDQQRKLRTLKMARLVSQRGVRERLELAEGQEVGVEEEDEKGVERGRVMKVEGDQFEVELYDQGERRKVKRGQLFHLPSCLQTDSFPADCVKVTVVGLAPLYADPDWSEAGRLVVSSHLISSGPYEDVICRGRVLLQSNHFLWLDRCLAENFSPRLKTWLVHMDLQSDLVRRGWAVAEPRFRDHLIALSLNAGLDVSQFQPREKLVKLKPDQDPNNSKPQRSLVDDHQSVDEGETEEPFFNEEDFDDLQHLQSFIERSISKLIIGEQESEEEDLELDPPTVSVSTREPSEPDVCHRPKIVLPENDGHFKRLEESCIPIDL